MTNNNIVSKVRKRLHRDYFRLKIKCGVCNESIWNYEDAITQHFVKHISMINFDTDKIVHEGRVVKLYHNKETR